MMRFLPFLLLLTTLPMRAVDSAGTTPTTQVKTMADLCNMGIPIVSGRLTAIATGRLSENDGFGGIFYYSSSSTTATNLGTVFKPAGSNGRWIRASTTPMQAGWFGLTTDGTGDNQASIANALTTMGKGTLHFPRGTIRVASTITLSRGQSLQGEGDTSDPSSSVRAATTLLKNGSFDLVTFADYDCGLYNLQLDGNSNGGNGLYAPYGQVRVYNCTFTGNTSGKGLYVGNQAAGPEADQSIFMGLKVLSNQDGLYMDSANAGLPDANINNFIGCDFRSNTRDGVALGRSFDNVFTGCIFTLNGQYGVHATSGAKGNKFYSCYSEANVGLRDYYFTTGTAANRVDGTRQGTDPIIVDDTATATYGGANDVLSTMGSRVANAVWQQLYFKDVRIIGDGFVGQGSLTQTADDTYVFNSVPGNNFSTWKFRTGVTGAAGIDLSDINATRQVFITGVAGAYDAFLTHRKGSLATMNMASYNTDNSWIAFDAHFDSASGLFKSDYVNSNFRLYKVGDTYNIDFSSGNAANASITWTNGLSVARSGTVSLGPNSTLIVTTETASRAAYIDASKALRSSTTTSTELGYLTGTSSSVQNQLGSAITNNVNAGTGIGVYASKSAQVATFNSLTGTGGIGVSSNASTITITYTGTTNVVNAGTGSGILSGVSAQVATLNSIAGAGGITISSNANVLTATLSVTNNTTIAVSDTTSTLTTGTGKQYWRAPYAFTLKDVRASVSTVSSSGLPTVNIKKNGTTIFSTKLTIDANEKTSVTAATPYVFSTTAVADDDELTFDIDTAGTGAVGLMVKLFYTRP